MRTPVRPDPRHDLSLRITLIAVMRLSNERKTQHTRAFPHNTPLPTVISYTQSGPTHNEMKRTSSLLFVFHVCVLSDNLDTLLPCDARVFVHYEWLRGALHVQRRSCTRIHELSAARAASTSR